MIVLCYLLAALFLSGPADAQPLTCDTLPFPPGDPCIEHTPQTQVELGPLYPEGSTVIVIFVLAEETRVNIKEMVELYFDCSNLVTPPEGGGGSPEVLFFQGDDPIDPTSQDPDRRILDTDVLYLNNTSALGGAGRGSQGTYYCDVCPDGTPLPLTRADLDPGCATNGSVHLTILRDEPQVCVAATPDAVESTHSDRIVYKPGRNPVCLTESSDNPNEFALIDGNLFTGSSYFVFVCQLPQGVSLQGNEERTVTLNGEVIAVNDEALPDTSLCPTSNIGDDSCGVFEFNEPLTIGDFTGILNGQIETYHGLYTCNISVPNTGLSDSASLLVTNCEPPVITRGTSTTPMDGMLTVGDAACVGSTLTCPVDVSPGTPYTITWERDGMNIETVSEMDDASLTIGANIPGMYTCTATNRNGSDSAVSIVIAPPMLDSTLTITTTFTSGCERVTDGNLFDGCPALNELALFSCQYAASVPVDVQNQAGVLNPHDNLGNLIPPGIMFLSSAQDGIYSCRATNPVCSNDVARQNFNIAVHDSPQIFTNYMAMSAADLGVNQVIVVGQGGTTSFTMGESLALVCPHSGIQQPTVQWFLNDTNVDDTGDARITITPTLDPSDTSIYVSTLSITNLMGSDNGVYECLISNNVIDGDVSAAAILGEVVAPMPVLTITIIDDDRRDVSSTSCARLSPRPADINACPFVGDRVVISCASDPPGTPATLHVPPMGAMHPETSITAPSIQEGDIPNGVYSCRLNGDADSRTLQLYAPPTISRTAALPTVPDGQLIVGVGRTQGEEIAVTPGVTTSIFCPFTGLDQPTATFSRLVDGVYQEIQDGEGPYSIVTSADGLTLTITDFSPEDAGTYQCTASNVAGEATVTTTLIAERQSIWVESPWSACEPDCHNGIRTRKVLCREIPGNVLQPDSECRGQGTKPPTVEQCFNRGPCFLTPQWGHGDWTDCTQPCGGGYRTRDIFCIIPRTGELVEHSQCEAHSVPPNDFEYCNSHPCCAGDLQPDFCALIRGTAYCSYAPYTDICCWSCSGGALE